MTVPTATRRIRYGSLCSGIASEHVAWEPLGWRCRWLSEIDPFACEFLAQKHPRIPNLGDMAAIDADKLEDVDLVVGGTPCQAFSINNIKRKGLDDARGNLSLRYVQIVDAVKPRWFVWENVPECLSMDRGRAFGSIVSAVAECGYGWAYRVFDLRGFGVPQRRRRLFLVGCAGGHQAAALALFDRLPDGEDRRPAQEVGLRRVAGTRRVDGWSGDETPKRIPNAAPTLKRSQGGEGTGVILGRHLLRKFSVTEQERLQGFPDGYTACSYKGKPASDTMRRKAIGNSFPPQALAWIGGRIDKLDRTLQES